MDLSWESFYAQFPGLHSPVGCDGFDVDLFFEKTDKTKKNSKDAVLEEYVPDNALVYMEETLDLDKLTELSSLTSKDISNETHMVVEIPNQEVKSEACSALYYYNYDESNNVQCTGNKSLDSSNHAVVKKPALHSNNLNFMKLADVLPPDSEEFLQNLLYESEANTITSSEEFALVEPLTPPSPLAVVPSTPVQFESDATNSEDESNETSNIPKQRILLPKGTIAYTLDLIPGTNTYMVTESRVPVPEDSKASVAGTLSNNDLLALGISSTTYLPEKMEEETTTLDSYPSPAAASPRSEASWSGSNCLQVSYPSPSPSTSSGSDTEWVPSNGEWGETRGTPYGRRSKRSPEERKMRKMEQNKTAALRYRKKKHQEMNKSEIERDGLLTKNEDLKKVASDLSTELKYIKKLLKEVCQAKGLLQ